MIREYLTCIIAAIALIFFGCMIMGLPHIKKCLRIWLRILGVAIVGSGIALCLLAYTILK